MRFHRRALTGLALALACASSLSLRAEVPAGTLDVLFGLENPTPAEWSRWYEGLVHYRQEALKAAGFDDSIYRDPRQAWSDTAFRQFYVFMYDEEFFRGGRYRTAELIETLKRRFGPVDSVLLWHAYPQLGYDLRTQFDFYRQMPGGLEGLRREAVDVFHAAGIHVFLDFNPWDLEPATDQYRELAQVVAALDADGVMLDTMDSTPPALKAAVDAAKPGVVFAPERRPEDRELSRARESWAQWYDLGEDQPSVYRQRWLVPQHLQTAIRRWDTDRQGDIVYGFFNGSGLLIWDNVFGSWNPYSPSDRALLAQTSLVQHRYARGLARGRWSPLIPTGVKGLDANRWDWTEGSGERTLILFRNRSGQDLRVVPPATWPKSTARVFWPEPADLAAGQEFVVPAGGTQAIAWGDDGAGMGDLRQRWLATLTPAGEPGYDERTPVPVRATADVEGDLTSTIPADSGHLPDGFVGIPGGKWVMQVEHMKRETGCYPFGADDYAMWGWFYKDRVTHSIPATVRDVAIRRAPVTRGEFLEFVRVSGYHPRDDFRFLQEGGSLSDPVTYVSLEDARAYARFRGERLPSEEEWQWAAETGSGQLEAMSGAGWELTESEYDDGHTRFVMLRGGIDLPPNENADWMVARGPHPPSFHAKYLLQSPGLDRSAKITFRTVIDLASPGRGASRPDRRR
ncbi:MAG TPA: SUMF1/EgtB/PvdO family nonheme iron enzyme [Bdellovibrionota bacterium]|nr:SUMF1/EgtB/PvdO family nonheme iron enzyme [Bdellovibrionota bacterium]